MKLCIDVQDRSFFLNTVKNRKPPSIVLDYRWREHLAEFADCFVILTYDMSKLWAKIRPIYNDTTKGYQRLIKKHDSVEQAKEIWFAEVKTEIASFVEFCNTNSEYIDIVEIPFFHQEFNDSVIELLKSLENIDLMYTVRDLSEDIDSLIQEYSYLAFSRSLDLAEVESLLTSKMALIKSFKTKLHIWNTFSKSLFTKKIFYSYSTTDWSTGSRLGNTYDYVGNLKICTYNPKRGNGKDVRKRFKSKCLQLDIDYNSLLDDDSETVDDWNLSQFNALARDLSFVGGYWSEKTDITIKKESEKDVYSLAQRENTETDLANYDAVSRYSRACNSCFLNAQCPAFRADSDCSIDTRPSLNGYNDYKSLLNKVIEIQSERVLFAAFAEKTQNAGLNPEVSQEIEKLTAVMKDAKTILSQNDESEVTIKAKGSSVISQIFGNYGRAGGGSKPSQSEAIIDISPMETEDE